MRTLLAAAVLACSATHALAQACPSQGAHLQVLGSGDASLTAARAQSGFLLWREGRARAMVNAGSGTALRLREAGADVRDLAVVLLASLGPEASADLPTLLLAMRQSGRSTPLLVLGPGSTDAARSPGTRGLLGALVAQPYGAWRGLDSLLTQGKPFAVFVDDLDTARSLPHRVAERDGLSVFVAGNGAGALAWRVELGGGAAGAFLPPRAPAGIAQGTRLAVALGDPAALGAALEGVRGLLLAGRGSAASPEELAAALALRANYDGVMLAAEDLACYPLD